MNLKKTILIIEYSFKDSKVNHSVMIRDLIVNVSGVNNFT
jgi:hypothetical protein